VTPAAALGDEPVRSLAREILGRSEYARFRPLEIESLRDLARSLAEFFARLAASRRR
jgi:hypothetical protein